MRTPFTAAIIGGLLIAQSATAQGFAEGWTFTGKGEAVIVVSTLDDVERLPAETGLGELSFRATGKKTLENSAQIGFRFEAKAQRDNPARAGYSGNIEPVGSTSLPTSSPIRGVFSGLTRFGPVENAGATGSIETAQIYIDGGFGQLSAGLGRGVATRFHEGAPDIFTHARAANPKLDPAGVNIVRTENDLTGPAAKITYQTPRLLGVRAGVSYTPEANAAGVDRDPSRNVPGVFTPELDNVIEGSVQLSRKLTEQDLRIRASASYARGEVSITNSEIATEDVDVWNAGIELEFDTVSIGADYLTSNNGIEQSGDYSAWSVGVTKELSNWEWGLRYGESEDENIAVQGQNWSFGASTKISQNLRIALGYQVNDVKFGPLTANSLTSQQISGPKGIVVEVTLSH